MAGDRPQKQLRSLGLYRQACGRTLVANATLQDIGTWHEDPCSNPDGAKYLAADATSRRSVRHDARSSRIPHGIAKNTVILRMFATLTIPSVEPSQAH